MKRLLFIAVIWGAALLPPAAQAQRGMGFRGSPAPVRTHSGFVGRPAGMPSGGFVSRPSGFAARPAPTFSSVSPVRTTSRVRFASPRSRVFIGGRTFFPGHRRFHRFARNPFFFPHSCFNGFFDPFCNNGFFFGNGFVGPFDPFFSGFSSGFSAPVAEQQPVVVEQDGNSRELALEVQELSDEIAAMRDEERTRAESKPATKPAVQDLGPDTIFVFRDGLQLTAHNYAVAGDTLWVLDEHTARKIPISKLDIPATEQANAKNGVEIHLPK